MAYPFVQARWYTKGAMTEARAVIWHMAEGWGTVGYFERTARNVSSHFVIERTGRIVQMVALTDASHTQHVQFDPDDADAEDCGIYSEAVGRAVLGTGWVDVNRYAVGIEVEGFRADGPNAAQVESIAELAAYLRRTLPTLRGALGHRDVQDYKGCPGCKFPWARVGGHGLFTEDEPMAIYERRARTGQFTVEAGSAPRGYRATPTGWEVAKTWTPIDRDSGGVYDYQLVAIDGASRPSSLIHVVAGFFGDLFVSTAEVTETVDPPPVPDCKAVVAAELEKAALRAAAAVREGVPV